MSLQIRSAVARATRTVVPFWPLSSFIAVNPLGAREQEEFDTVAPLRAISAYLADYRSGRITGADVTAAALGRIPELAAASSIDIGDTLWSAAEIIATELAHCPIFSAPPVALERDLVDDLVAKWLGAYLDPHPLWAMPDRQKGLWTAWRSLAQHDPQLPAIARKRLRELPESADEALGLALERMGVTGTMVEVALRREAQRSPGWTAHVKWRAEHTSDIDLTSYFAVRITLRWALGLPLVAPVAAASAAPDTVWERTDRLCALLGNEPVNGEVRGHVARILALHPVQRHAATWQHAYELHYRLALLDSLCTEPAALDRPRVQVVMCIDPRSEGMRRHLERAPWIETYGFAGFFGVPIRFAQYLARGAVDALPALLSARHSVTERTAHEQQGHRRTNALRVRDAILSGLHASESTAAAPFALAETAGWFSGAATVLRTLAPATSARAARAIRRLTTPALQTEVTIAEAFSLEERAALAENAIRMMGLDHLAGLVVLSGHGSTSSNNLYQSALDCGACGGNPGGANARAAAAIFNDPDVRTLLSARGLPVPDSTFFVAAEHNTVSDHIGLLDTHLVPETHRAVVHEFVTAQASAADALVAERAAQLPGGLGRRLAQLRARAHDWAEVYPELGLAGNAAMIVGPRAMTRGTDLHRRVFLHSYLAELDPDGSALETIMTAPLVVAQWINHQYYFSTVVPDQWGAGTKTIHNAIGTLGVMSGQSGDLRLGLPHQSVAVGDRSLHEPLRLSVLIEAPLDRISTIVSRNQVLRQLFDNNWITLTARDAHDQPWHRYSSYGWQPLSAPILITEGETR